MNTGKSLIKNEVSSGLYGSASEVVRDALRTLEDHKMKLEALRLHLNEGVEQAKRGEFINHFSVERLISETDPS